MESIDKLRKYADGFVTVQTHDDLMGIIDEIEAEIAERVSYEQAAKAWNTRAERTCNIIGFDDGIDEGIDGEWHQYAEPQYDLSCGHSSQGVEAPNYCPNCGAKVVSE